MGKGRSRKKVKIAEIPIADGKVNGEPYVREPKTGDKFHFKVWHGQKFDGATGKEREEQKVVLMTIKEWREEAKFFVNQGYGIEVLHIPVNYVD